MVNHSRVTGLAVLASLALSVVLSGCASSPNFASRVDPLITPVKVDISPARLGIFAFHTPFGDPDMESYLAEEFHQMLLRGRICRVVEVIPEGYRDNEAAIERARHMGYDVVVIGKVSEAFFGGDSVKTRATVEIRTVDVVRNMTLWYLRASGEAEPEPARNYILWRTDGKKAPLPLDLVRRLMQEIAAKMTEPPAG